MPERRRTHWTIAGVLGLAALATAAVIGIRHSFLASPRAGSQTGETPAAEVVDLTGSIKLINDGLRNGDQKMLPVLRQRLVSSTEKSSPALSDSDAADSIDSLAALRTGFPSFAGPSRAVAISLACQILDQFGVEPAPSRWLEALAPVHDLLSAGFVCSDPTPRVAALTEMGRFWVWLPGCSLTPLQERQLSDWKESIFRPVVRCLASPDPRTRVAAVACLGRLPLDDRAMAAIPYLEDPSSVEVRKQTLISFARRPTILSDDMLLKRLNDKDPSIGDAATVVLKTRGFTQEQISMGALIFSSKPEQRISIIPMLKNRADLDPVVWLVQLSRDPVEMVRMSAVDALAIHKSPAAQRRLTEMAQSDASESVRRAASKLLPPIPQTTAALPLLPGSPSYNPKAN